MTHNDCTNCPSSHWTVTRSGECVYCGVTIVQYSGERVGLSVYWFADSIEDDQKAITCKSSSSPTGEHGVAHSLVELGCAGAKRNSGEIVDASTVDPRRASSLYSWEEWTGETL